jgi:hypothetical protein
LKRIWQRFKGSDGSCQNNSEGKTTVQKTLFNIGAELIALNDLLDEIGGDVSEPAVELAVTAWFGELEAEQGAKLDNYIGLIRTLEMEAHAAGEEADRYTAIEEARANRAAWLKDRLKAHLEATGQPKATTVSGRVVAVQKNGGKKPLGLADDLRIDDLDERFRRVVVSADTDAIRKALEAGEVIEGATLREPGTHLRIR